MSGCYATSPIVITHMLPNTTGHLVKKSQRRSYVIQKMMIDVLRHRSQPFWAEGHFIKLHLVGGPDEARNNEWESTSQPPPTGRNRKKEKKLFKITLLKHPRSNATIIWIYEMYWYRRVPSSSLPPVLWSWTEIVGRLTQCNRALHPPRVYCKTFIIFHLRYVICFMWYVTNVTFICICMDLYVMKTATNSCQLLPLFFNTSVSLCLLWALVFCLFCEPLIQDSLV